MIEIMDNQIIQGDSLVQLKKLPPKTADLVFADPPYNLQLHTDLYRPNNTRVDAVNDEWDKFPDFKAYDDFTHDWLSACRTTLKDTGTLWVIGSYHNIYRIGKIMQDLGYWILNDIIWVKRNPMPNFRGVRFTNAHETMLWAQKNRGAKYTFNHRALKALNDDLQMRSDWYLPLCTGSERVKVKGKKAHTTQKPEALLYRILMASTKPGDLVLDPFFGTGTTGVVAKRLGRRWIGIEKKAEYIQIARQRIAKIKQAPENALNVIEKRQAPRVPFGTLLEAGFIRPGDKLIFNNDSDIQAIVLASGQLNVDGITGSIHQVAKHLADGPSNGWENWYYKKSSGDWAVIDELRIKFREMCVYEEET